MNNEIGTFKRAFEMLGYKNLVVKNFTLLKLQNEFLVAKF